MISLKKHRRIILATWCLYDWASASFPIIVTTFIFATYFTSRVAADTITGTYQWANATAIAGLIIAATSPLFGAIADYSGHHKRWLFFFSLLCIISTSLLWYAYPAVDYVIFTLVCVIIGTIGLEISLVFYNAFLPHLAKPNSIGRLSGIGWGCGYLGGILALTLTLVLFVKSTPAWLNTQSAEQIRICGPLAGIWYLLFSLPFFLLIPETGNANMPLLRAIRSGTQDLISTLKSLPKQKNMLIYLISHMIYTDGLNTLFAFGGIYAAGTLHFSFSEVLVFGIMTNIMAGIGAIGLSWVDDYLGSKSTILISLVCLLIFGIVILVAEHKYTFWIGALLLSLFLGPAQSASRSLMTRLIIPEKATEMFGLYALSGKATAFIGPWLLGSMTLLFDSQRVGMATILVFFLIGGWLLLYVKEQPEIPLAK
ncbi:MAG: MFS transporter [Gammaproteobacteria bacterium RIFCSPHIGHO2_12_FULL_45_9]|nr:MAG: MFS transporter [Gammaproteobacteria bacterium RIFCSPHIGHO2_12_FULL_45_9]